MERVIIGVAFLLLAAPSFAGPFVRFNSAGLNENDRVYELSAGNSHVEIGVGIDSTGQTSGNILGRRRF